MIRPTEVEDKVLCRICGEEVEEPVRRWLGSTPICRRCITVHKDHMAKLEEEENEDRA